MIISPDAILVAQQGGYYWTPENVAKAWAEAYRQYGSALVEGVRHVVLMCGPSHCGKSTLAAKKFAGTRDVVCFDATFTLPIRRAAVLHIAIGAGATVEAWAGVEPYPVCLARWKQGRQAGNRKSLAIGESVVALQHQKYVLPTMQEGFSKVSWFDRYTEDA